ncbi:MAG: sulfatase/phosphatase domain-containing protein, partial [Planctomycetaceae bacterium]
VSLHEESAQVPLIISVPDGKPAVCHSFVELLDLYPTLSAMCGLEVPTRLQGRDISKTLKDPAHEVRTAAFCVNGRGFLLRDHDWAFLQYGEQAERGIELFDMRKDPHQYQNLASDPEFRPVVDRFRKQLREKLKAVRDNDLGA